jgi:hypothetical protein
MSWPTNEQQVAPLGLSLHHQDKIYAAGDTITGTIHNWNQHQINGSWIELILAGRSKSTLQLPRKVYYTHKDRVPLIYHVEKLQPAESDGEIHFSIAIPHRVQKDLSGLPDLKKRLGYWTHTWSDSPFFNTQSEHELPPSIAMSRSLLVTNGDLCGSGHIHYTLTAVISNIGESGEKTEIFSSDEETLDITTSRISVKDWEELSRNNQTTDSSTFTLMLPEKGLQFKSKEKPKLAIMKKIEQAFGKNPSLTMATQITFPRAATVGSSITFSLRLGSVSSSHKNPNGFTLPPITLQRVEVFLKDTIALRCSRPVMRLHEHINEFPGRNVGEMSCQVNHVFNPMDDGKGYQNTECQVEFEIPASCSPTFMTWNVSNQWYLHVNAFFKCLGKVSTKSYYGGIKLISEPKLSVNSIGEAKGLSGKANKIPRKKVELQGNRAVAELGGDRAVVELHGDRAVAELHGDRAVAELHGDKAVAELHGDRAVAELPGHIEVAELPA